MDNDTAHQHIKSLLLEIEILTKRLQPHDTGHLHTTISVLKERVAEILKDTGRQML
jgi:hypothetical protein